MTDPLRDNENAHSHTSVIKSRASKDAVNPLVNKTSSIIGYPTP